MSFLPRHRRPAEARTAEAVQAPTIAGADGLQTRESDIDIARRARAALTRRLGCLIGTTEVTVLNGAVEIRGSLENGDQKNIAEQTIAGLAGVRMVINRIRISPPSKLAMRTLFR